MAITGNKEISNDLCKSKIVEVYGVRASREDFNYAAVNRDGEVVLSKQKPHLVGAEDLDETYDVSEVNSWNWICVDDTWCVDSGPFLETGVMYVKCKCWAEEYIDDFWELQAEKNCKCNQEWFKTLVHLDECVDRPRVYMEVHGVDFIRGMFNYVAVDEGGTVFAYEHEPHIVVDDSGDNWGMWFSSRGGVREVGVGCRSVDWRTTLIDLSTLPQLTA